MYKKAFMTLVAVGLLTITLFRKEVHAQGNDFSKGLRKLNETTYIHEDGSGNISVGWKFDYHFNNSSPSRYGYMDYGWFTDNTGTYFLNTTLGDSFGKKVRDWQWIDGYCYYFDSEGRLVRNFSGLGEASRTNEHGQWVSNGVLQQKPGTGFSSVLNTQASSAAATNPNVAGLFAPKDTNQSSTSNYTSPSPSMTDLSASGYVKDVLIIEAKSGVAKSYVDTAVAAYGGSIEAAYDSISTYKVKFGTVSTTTRLMEIKNALQSDAQFSNVFLDVLTGAN